MWEERHKIRGYRKGKKVKVLREEVFVVKKFPYCYSLVVGIDNSRNSFIFL